MMSMFDGDDETVSDHDVHSLTCGSKGILAPISKFKIGNCSNSNFWRVTARHSTVTLESIPSEHWEDLNFAQKQMCTKSIRCPPNPKDIAVTDHHHHQLHH